MGRPDFPQIQVTRELAVGISCLSPRRPPPVTPPWGRRAAATSSRDKKKCAHEAVLEQKQLYSD